MAILVNRLTWATLTHLKNSDCLSYSAVPFGYSFNGTPNHRQPHTGCGAGTLVKTPSLNQTEAAPEHQQICRKRLQPSQSQLATNWQPESQFLEGAEKSAGIKNPVTAK